MNYIYSVLKYLCKKSAIIILTNLAIKNCDFTSKINEDVNCQPLKQIEFKPAIGKYWLHVPSTRLMITTLIPKQQICIHIGKSINISMNKKCILNIDENGIS